MFEDFFSFFNLTPAIRHRFLVQALFRKSVKCSQSYEVFTQMQQNCNGQLEILICHPKRRKVRCNRIVLSFYS